ncbi:hypothetical protein GWK47_026216 [Chionoecetes opilio]|uniref:Uncharacterized protein n=1 Tax=Chionoecetes opilio TaxID=41210 RepID=A0A8J8WDA5_CHIOP|nr:hypothetical protein GWK47_026216 [Chionoecetes opilio]
MKVVASSSAVPRVRRRVYVLGIISAVVAAVQIAGYLVMLSLVLDPEHFDGQVAGLNAAMVLVTSVYLALTGRLLFLFHESRYEETRGPEWLWWFCTMGVVMFNLILVVWFALLPDPIPGAVCGGSTLLYLLFFKFAKDDLKFLRDTAAAAAPVMVSAAAAAPSATG